MKLLLLFFLLAGLVSAETVTVVNESGSPIEVDGQAVASASQATITTAGSVVLVEFPGGVRSIDVREGSLVAVDSTAVTVATPLSAYYSVFLKGFWLGLGFELFGLILSLVRKVRAGTGME